MGAGLYSGILTLFFIVALQSTFNKGFKREQMKYSRVVSAAGEKSHAIRDAFRKKGLPYPPQRIFIRIFKQEREVELWTGRGAYEFDFLKSYAFCATSGRLGPKRQQGDAQIPEGFYVIDRFNPYSNFHLSLGLNYPNKSDRILGSRKPGGDIFIHGGCATIGCVPITDDGIKELYLIAVESRSAGQRSIPVHIFPARMNEQGIRRLRREYSGDTKLWEFWMNLQEGFAFFEKNRRLPKISVDARGRYLVEAVR